MKIKTKKSSKRASEGKNAEKARLVEDFLATTGYLNFNPPKVIMKKSLAPGIIPRYRRQNADKIQEAG